MPDNTSTETPAPTADEQPKKKIAKKVVSTKRRYFFPHHNQSVEADTIGRAISIVKKRKDGDA